MDEITWQIVQIIFWIVGIQTTIIIGAMGFIWNNLSKRIDKVELRIDKLELRIDKLEDRMTRLENHMIEIKTILRMKECCMITDERQVKKAE